MPKSILKSSRGNDIPDDFKRIDTGELLLRKTARKQKRKNQQIRPITASSQISENISQLAEPKRRYSENCDDSHWAIKKSTLNYKRIPLSIGSFVETIKNFIATKRIKCLAQPKTVSPKVTDASSSVMSPISSVTPSALKYRPSQRILDLARPKDWMYYEHYVP